MKKAKRKPTLKKKVRFAPPSPSIFRTFLIAVAVVILAALLITFILPFFSHQSTPDVVVTVNGEQITQRDLDFQYNLLPESYRSTFTEDQVLQQIIDEELVVQAGKRIGVNASQQEVHERVQQILAQSETSVADLENNLAQLNITQDQFEGLVARQIMIEKYLNQTLQPPQPDDVALQALYNATKQKYAVGEMVTVRHILISNQRPDAALIAKGVYDKIRSGADFCTLAQNASDDRGSRYTCGYYTFPRGFMVPEFEKASFAMKDGELRMIQTQFGYHVLQKMNSTPARIKTFDEVKDDLVSQYNAADHARQYQILLSTLRSEATLVYPNGTTVLPNAPAALAPADKQDQVNQDQAVNKTNQTSVAPQPEQQTAPTPLPEQVPSALPEQTPQPAVDSSIFNCIANKTVLYGTDWDTDSQDALRFFAKQGVTLPYIACDAQPDFCKAKGIKGYPTWHIDGKTYIGRMGIDELQRAASC